MTKLACLVLICVVTLTVVTGVSFALSFGVTQRMGAAFSKGSAKVNGLADALAQGRVPLGDAIISPKPNGLETLV